MINFNGTLHNEEAQFLNHTNRGLRYGDALFETIRAVHGALNFWEDHYLRLMASMRILRMEIPMSFTMEYLLEQVSGVLHANALEKKSARVRFTVFRKEGGRYAPETNTVSFIIEAQELDTPFFTISEKPYAVELFKDFYVNRDMLSTLKTNNKIINVLGSVFAQENGVDNCLLVNNAKQVVEALQGNLFLVKGNTLKTPPMSDGCLNGIIRKKIVQIVEKSEDYILEEDSITPFELQKADALFITNAIVGIQPITHYRKKKFVNTVAKDLLAKLNTLARLERVV